MISFIHDWNIAWSDDKKINSCIFNTLSIFLTKFIDQIANHGDFSVRFQV